MLEQRNIFLVPLDNERCWYRYHQLFADVLRHRLQQTQPGALSELHRRASQWYESEGLLPEAVAHALATRDFEHAAQLIERGVEKLWQRGEITTLTGWMRALPDNVRRARPAVCLAYARVLADMAQYTAMEALLAEAEHELESHPPADNSLAACLRGQAIALRAHLAVPRGEFARAIELTPGSAIAPRRRHSLAQFCRPQSGRGLSLQQRLAGGQPDLRRSQRFEPVRRKQHGGVDSSQHAG
jgi:LuxR family maltose regulon positive regulatory protein